MRVKSTHILVGAAAAVIAAAGGVALWLLASADTRALGKALHPERYDTVCVKAEIKTEYLGAGETNGDALGQDGYYVDKDGNLLQPGDEGYPEQSEQAADFEPIVTMERAEGIVHETGISGETYFFVEDGQDRVLYLDTNGGLEEEGTWTKAPLERYNLKPLFDPESLAELSTADFVRGENGFVPAAGRIDEVFHTLVGTSEENRERYIVYALVLTVEDGRLQSMTAEYEMGATVRLTQKWTFSYSDIRLTLPEAEKDYTALGEGEGAS